MSDEQRYVALGGSGEHFAFVADLDSEQVVCRCDTFGAASVIAQLLNADWNKCQDYKAAEALTKTRAQSHD